MDGLLKRISSPFSPLCFLLVAKGAGSFSRSTRRRTISLVLETRFGSHPPTKMHSLDSIIMALKGGRKSVTYEEEREDREDWIKAKHAAREPLFEAPYF